MIRVSESPDKDAGAAEEDKEGEVGKAAEDEEDQDKKIMNLTRA